MSPSDPLWWRVSIWSTSNIFRHYPLCNPWILRLICMWFCSVHQAGYRIIVSTFIYWFIFKFSGESVYFNAINKVYSMFTFNMFIMKKHYMSYFTYSSVLSQSLDSHKTDRLSCTSTYYTYMWICITFIVTSRRIIAVWKCTMYGNREMAFFFNQFLFRR